MYQLFINNEEIDLNQSTRILLRRLIFDLKDFDKRGMTITNTITVPPTHNNLSVLGNPERISSNNLAFEGTNTYTLLDSTGILAQGTAIVKSFNKDRGAKLQLSQGFGFWGQAAEKKLNDLVNHGDDFQFTDANMDALKVKSGSVFLTALHTATGNTTDTALTTYQYTRPFVNFKPLLDKIVADLGYTIDYGQVLERTPLEDIGCSSNSDEFACTDYKRRFENVTLDGLLNFTTGSSIIPPTFGNTSEGPPTQLGFALYKTSIIVKGQVNAPSATSIDIILSNRTERIAIPRGLSFVNYKTDVDVIGGSAIISCPDSCVFNDVYVYTHIKESDIFEVEGAITLSNANDDAWVLSDYNLPLITYKQFIKVMMKMFFLDLSVNESSRVITFRVLGDAIDSNNFTDMSGRIDENDEFTSGDIYGRLNNMKYENDEDLDTDLGTLFFTVKNDNADPVKTFLEISEFSASNEVEVSGENVVSYIIYNVTANNRSSIKDRIVFFNETGAFGFNAEFNPISWPRLYSDYYYSFIDNTKRERVFQLDAILNKNLFNRLQEIPLIYDRDLESYFVISEIKNFEEDRLSRLIAVRYG